MVVVTGVWQYKASFRARGGERRPRMGYKPVVGWGTLPDGWSFVEATAVAVDADDDVWVFNRGAHPVIVFDRGGAFKRDRKSTRLNSSHRTISYAVFCLKKKIRRCKLDWPGPP